MPVRRVGTPIIIDVHRPGVPGAGHCARVCMNSCTRFCRPECSWGENARALIASKVGQYTNVHAHTSDYAQFTHLCHRAHANAHARSGQDAIDAFWLNKSRACVYLGALQLYNTHMHNCRSVARVLCSCVCVFLPSQREKERQG